MACNSCGATNQEKFSSEIHVHFPGLTNVDKIPVLIFPELLVCLNCGKTEFTVTKDELGQLANSDTSEILSPLLLTIFFSPRTHHARHQLGFEV